jgi:RNA polymerase sigma factor (sigma-70 family)
MANMNRERLTRLVTDKAPALLLYARQWLAPDAAEDALQEALTALLCQATAPEEPLAWMYRALRNRAIDTARAESRRRRREQSVSTHRAEWFDASPDALIDARTAEAVLRTLDDHHREIVLMRIWGDLSFASIAQILSLSVSTVHERYTAALEQLRTRLENPCPNQTK